MQDPNYPATEKSSCQQFWPRPVEQHPEVGASSIDIRHTHVWPGLSRIPESQSIWVGTATFSPPTGPDTRISAWVGEYD